MSHRPVLTFLLFSLLSVQPAASQEVTARLGVRRPLKSAILNEQRTAIVHLPASYDTSGRSYPVLYLLDGTTAFLLEMIGITNRLHSDQNAPEMIIVAVENTNRGRDMMPVIAKDFPGPPGAEAFLTYLDRHSRAREVRALQPNRRSSWLRSYDTPHRLTKASVRQRARYQAAAAAR
jgi:hypothetical protein